MTRPVFFPAHTNWNHVIWLSFFFGEVEKGIEQVSSHVIVRLKFTQRIPGVTLTVVYNRPTWFQSGQTSKLLLVVAVLVYRMRLKLFAKRSFVRSLPGKRTRVSPSSASHSRLPRQVQRRWKEGPILSLTSQRSLCVSDSGGSRPLGEGPHCCAYTQTESYSILVNFRLPKTSSPQQIFR